MFRQLTADLYVNLSHISRVAFSVDGDGLLHAKVASLDSAPVLTLTGAPYTFVLVGEEAEALRALLDAELPAVAGREKAVALAARR